ncbi:MAG: hypothetical protein CSA74_12105 [Rhodobacterales bacterium]|nr:MAG: hypothetical protein CSA74_12105 [Rhodobacterales bacterium]
MTTRTDPADRQKQTLTRHLPVFLSEHFTAIRGANEGDPLGDAADLACEDVYALAPGARHRRLGLDTDPATGALHVAPASGTGQPGARVFLDSLLTFMDPGSATRDALVFVETDSDGNIAAIYLAPLAPFLPGRGYTLVTIDRSGAPARLAETAAVAFTRGTRITLAGGIQRPVEALKPGDRVLTRDSGSQVLRWIGCDTLRAFGPFAPIRIAPGALNNTGPLLVGPAHRLFVYQRVDALKAGQKEVLVRAELLVNGTTVTRQPGGFVDYFQLLFDKHEIIFAEGIAAESLLVDPTTEAALPDEIARRPRSGSALPAAEIERADLAQSPDVAHMLKRLSAL